MPPGPGVVEGGAIPYLPDALAERHNRFDNRLTDDPEGKCYLGGVPRSTYMPYPFQIFQSQSDVVMVYQFATAFRRIFVDGKEEAPLDSWMGWSNGRWDGDTFVVDGHGVERLRRGSIAPATTRAATRVSRSATSCSARITCSTKPRSKTRPCTRGRGRFACRYIASSTQDFRMLEFKCEPYAEEKVYGHLRKPGTEPPARGSSR